MLGSYWLVSFNILNFFALPSKKFFRKRVVFERNEARSGLVDHNALFNEMLLKIYPCDMAFMRSGKKRPFIKWPPIDIIYADLAHVQHNRENHKNKRHMYENSKTDHHLKI